MPQDKQNAAPLGLIALVGFNLVPLIGVLNWGWQSFDLIAREHPICQETRLKSRLMTSKDDWLKEVWGQVKLLHSI